MRILAHKTLRKFWESSPAYADAERPLRAWYRFVQRADWASPAEVKEDIGNASILRDGRVVFNIAGNKYRLVAWVNYAHKEVYICFVGTHAQYDEVDAQTIKHKR